MQGDAPTFRGAGFTPALPKPMVGFVPPPAAAKVPEKETNTVAATSKAGAGTKMMTKTEMRLAASKDIGADSMAKTHEWLQTEAAQ